MYSFHRKRRNICPRCGLVSRREGDREAGPFAFASAGPSLLSGSAFSTDGHMSDIATGRKVGPLICQALGLNPSRVQRLTMTVEPNSIVTLEVTMLTRVQDVEALGVVVAEYKLAPRDDQVEVTALADGSKRFDFFGSSPR